MKNVSFNQALMLIKANSKTLLSEEIDLFQASKRILATNLKSAINSPLFNNSAVDGIGITQPQLTALNANSELILTIKQTITAGLNISAENLADNQCLYIMTGAIVPLEIVAMIPIEKVNFITPAQIKMKMTVKLKANIRLAGEDFSKNDLLVAQNTKLNTHHLMLCSAAGFKTIRVYQKPKIAIFTTGKEIIAMGEELQNGQIYNSNLIFMATTLKEIGFEVIVLPHINDNMEALVQNIKLASQHKVVAIVSSGAVSMGKEDIVREYLANNSNIIYDKLAIRPGKPAMLAQVDNMLYFALAGNPVATAVGIELFVAHYFRFLHDMPQQTILQAKAKNTFVKNNKAVFFARGYCSFDAQAQLNVEFLNQQGSHMIKALALSNCFVALDKNITQVSSNDLVNIYLSLTTW